MYSSLVEFQRLWRIQLPKPFTWRLVKDQPSGQIYGLPTLRGLAVATNGIYVAVERSDAVLFGHLEHFICDRPEQAKALENVSSVSLPPKRLSLELAEMLL